MLKEKMPNNSPEIDAQQRVSIQASVKHARFYIIPSWLLLLLGATQLFRYKGVKREWGQFFTLDKQEKSLTK